MPVIRFQLALGGKEKDVATSTPSTFGTELIRVDVDFTAAMTRQLFLETLDEIAQRATEGNWPPA